MVTEVGGEAQCEHEGLERPGRGRKCVFSHWILGAVWKEPPTKLHWTSVYMGVWRQGVPDPLHGLPAGGIVNSPELTEVAAQAPPTSHGPGSPS